MTQNSGYALITFDDFGKLSINTSDSNGGSLGTVFNTDFNIQGDTQFENDVSFNSNVYINKSLDVSANVNVRGILDANTLHVQTNMDVNENIIVSGNLTTLKNIFYKNINTTNINGFLKTDSKGLVYSDTVNINDIKNNAITTSKILDNSITTSKILNNSITSEKLASDLYFKGYPLVDDVNNALSKNIVNVNYVKSVKSEIMGNVSSSLNTLEKLAGSVDNDNVFHEKIARLTGANFTGAVNLTKISYGSSIRNFINILDDETVLFNDTFMNFNLVGQINKCYLPDTVENGTTILVLNNTENDVSIHSTYKIYHYILAPPSGLNVLSIMPNMLYSFLFYENKWMLTH